MYSVAVNTSQRPAAADVTSVVFNMYRNWTQSRVIILIKHLNGE